MGNRITHLSFIDIDKQLYNELRVIELGTIFMLKARIKLEIKDVNIYLPSRLLICLNLVFVFKRLFLDCNLVGTEGILHLSKASRSTLKKMWLGMNCPRKVRIK